jgi:hypothetical protein
MQVFEGLVEACASRLRTRLGFCCLNARQTHTSQHDCRDDLHWGRFDANEVPHS